MSHAVCMGIRLFGTVITTIWFWFCEWKEHTCTLSIRFEIPRGITKPLLYTQNQHNTYIYDKSLINKVYYLNKQ